MKRLLFALFIMWVGGATAIWYWNEGRPSVVSFRTVTVTQGDLLATINATGTLEPEEVVDVGAQIAGEIVSFGEDPQNPSQTITHGSVVDAGTVLAKLGDKLFVARVNQDKANVEKAEADLETAEVKLKHANRELDRAQRLSKSRQISAQEFDTLASEAETAKATVDVARGSLALARANLEEASVNLGYTTIASPVKGVIVDRRVNIGQTVVASLNAPSLFLIAKDLSKMEIWASVNETDVGQIRQGQKATFTVAAFPKETFAGRVKQIRLNASMSQSVVTYTVVVDVDNSAGRLLPYLTARLQFEVEERKQATLVPNAALRWSPSPSHVAPGSRQESPEAPKTSSESAKSAAVKGKLWVRDGDFVRPIAVTVGLTDGRLTEMIGNDVQPGTEVVVGLSSVEDDAAGASPFLPKIKNDKAKR